MAQTPADPDAEMRAWLRAYATKHPCHGFRRAWAALRYDERREVNKKKVHRLWREEGLQVRVHSPRKRAGVSSIPPVEADAPNVVWAIDFQFDSTIDGKAIKIASMIDEHTREIATAPGGTLDHRRTPRRRTRERYSPWPAGRRRCCGWTTARNWFPKRCNGSATDKVGLSYIPPGCPWDNGYIESFNNRLRKECLNRNHWNTLSRPGWSSATSSTSTTTDTGTRPWATERRPSTLRRAGTPTPRSPARSTESGAKQPDSKSGWTQ